MLENITNSPILLYGTSDCHLCETAMEILDEHHIPYEFIDIAHDNNLVEQLGWFIPVIKVNDEMIKSPLNFNELLPKLKASL
ncbi:glutaredoxin family protein [Wohlfahrtiimonas sp. G9077]|uniref:glutaredoxin family protein n=1 Tax=Wohlfahrtiimonas sp. G9077 TaxID=1980118 RepID=UPI001F1FB759|nr:glutaredoxin family protein [Wohlfahrtiimonas sp. G9077]